MAHSKNGGHPGGQFGGESQSAANIRDAMLNQLRSVLKAFSSLTLATELATERTDLVKLRDRLAAVISDVECVRLPNPN